MKSFFKWLSKKPEYRFGEIYAHDGDIFTCSQCSKGIYKFTRDVFYGEIVEAEVLEGINGHNSPKSGDMCECPNCGEQIVW